MNYRTLDLEVEIGSLRKEASSSAGKVKQLEQDNVGLFERIKFLQHYQKGTSSDRQQRLDPSFPQTQASSCPAALELCAIRIVCAFELPEA